MAGDSTRSTISRFSSTGKLVWIFVLVDFHVGVEMLERVRGQAADLRLYDGGW